MTFARIIGTGGCLPEKVITNEELSKTVDTNDEWIMQRVGIKERHVVSNDETTCSLSKIAAERAIEADPKNYQAMLMLATGIASKVRENDLDKDARLAQAEKYANDAIANLQDAQKMNPGMTDVQWTAAKADYVADAHQALGMIAAVRKKNDVAVTEYQLAVTGASNPDPATSVRLGQALNKAGKYDEAIAVLDKVMAAPDVNPQVKQFAQAERVRSVTAKGGTPK